jgi:hypothetical protein
MELFSESVMSPSSEQAHQIVSSSEETSFDDDKLSVDDEEEPLILCFFDVTVDSSASSSSAYLCLLFVEAILFLVKAIRCWHSDLYGVAGIHSKEACAAVQ